MSPDLFWGATVPCAGKWALFDSTRPDHHREAAAICATCPLAHLAACRANLEQTLRLAHRRGGPRGTWAGQLVGETAAEKQRRTANPREHGTDRGYHQHRHVGEPACDACLAAHAAKWRERKAVA